MSKKILVACRVPESSLSLIRGLTHEIVVYEDHLPPDMREFDAVLIRGNVKADGNFLSRLKKGSVLIRLGVGTDNVDLKAAKELGVKVAIPPVPHRSPSPSTHWGSRSRSLKGYRVATGKLNLGAGQSRFMMALN